MGGARSEQSHQATALTWVHEQRAKHAWTVTAPDETSKAPAVLIEDSCRGRGEASLTPRRTTACIGAEPALGPVSGASTSTLGAPTKGGWV